MTIDKILGLAKVKIKNDYPLFELNS